MFKFLRKKEGPDSKLYPSFQARIFATLIDTALATIIAIMVSSVLNTTASMGYHDSLPSAKFAKAINNTPKKSAEALEPNHDDEYQKFFANHGYQGIIFEQFIQIALMGVATFIFWLKTHATPGKLLLSMKIVDAKTLKDPTTFQLIVRLLAYPISFLPLGLGIFYITCNKKRRAWHDIIAGTLVVNKKVLEGRKSTVMA